MPVITQGKATEILRTTLKKIAKSSSDKIGFFEQNHRRFEKWIQCELAYALNQNPDVRYVDTEWSRDYNKQKKIERICGREDVGFSVLKTKKDTYYSIELKQRFGNLNIKTLLKDLKKYDCYKQGSFDVRGVFLVFVCSSRSKKTRSIAV